MINTPPQTYYEWKQCFQDICQENDPYRILHLMERGNLEWADGLAERIVKSLLETINFFLNKNFILLQRDLNIANNSEHDISLALNSARKRYNLVIMLTKLEILPENIQAQLLDLIMISLNRIQLSLEDSAKHDSSGIITDIIKKNPVNKITLFNENCEMRNEINTNRRIILK